MFNIEKYTEIKGLLRKKAKSCEIIAISKNHPKESVTEAIKLGIRIFGENRVMEAKSKFSDLKNEYPEIQLHLTGPLQSNKVKDAVRLFDVFHTLDREKIVKEFSKFKEHLENKKIFIQVNTGEEETKSGVHPKHLNEFYKYCTMEMGLKICGLMCIPPISEDPRIHFGLLKKLAKENNLNKLSIGMSADYMTAIDFNPAYIRLGTLLFGQRQ